MRKHFKLKARSCMMCKPHKMHRAVRWKPKELQELKRWEKEERELAQR